MFQDFIPERYQAAYYILSAILAVVGVCALIYHMNGRWSRMATRGQRWRYYALLACAGSAAYTAIELQQLHVHVTFRHFLDVVCSCILLAAMYFSIKDDDRNEPPIP